MPGIFYLWGSRIYIYTKLYLALPPQHNILSVDFAYIYIRKTVMLNHVYQIYNCEILAFNILSVDPRFFNILTSSPLVYINLKCNNIYIYILQIGSRYPAGWLFMNLMGSFFWRKRKKKGKCKRRFLRASFCRGRMPLWYNKVLYHTGMQAYHACI